MGIVTDTLIALLKAQIHKHGTVVWYDEAVPPDPKGVYSDLAATLTADQVNAEAVFRYDPQIGFFDLRHQLERYWSSLELDTAPRLLIYVPLAQSNAHNALVEYEVGGVVMQPGIQPPEQSTELSVVARQALENVFPAARLAQIVEETAAGKLSLADLDQIAERGTDAQTGTLAVIFGTGNSTEVILKFLSETSFDTKINQRKAMRDVAKVFSETLGVDFAAVNEPTALRARAARQIILTDFYESLGDGAPASPIPLAVQLIARSAAIELARQWRNRRDMTSSYVKWAEPIQAEIGVGSLNIALDAFARSETFAGAETRLQILVEEALLKHPTAALIDLIRGRISGFWSSQTPEIKTRWEVVLNAGRVLQEAARIESSLKGKRWTASKLFAEYVYGDSPWCELDTVQRHLERDVLLYDFHSGQHDSLQRLIGQASQQYGSMVNQLAELFVKAYKDEQFELPDVQLQADVYRDFVAPRAKSGRVAYILVDAFRYEMAREFAALMALFEPSWSVDLAPALATPPTITDVGMAALMPGAEDGITLTLEKDKLIPQIGGKPIRSAKARFERFTVTLGTEPVVVALDAIAPLLKSSLIRKLSDARVVIVTASDEIDGLGENMPQKARRSFDDVLSLLRRGLSALVNVGIQNIIITADHGFILADQLDDSQKIDAPNNEKQGVLKRRVWVGVGGDSNAAVMRTPLSAFGIGGNLELVTPFGLSVFKVAGGNQEYFHGGLALQELVIPVLSILSNAPATSTNAPKLDWKLTLGSHKITSPYISVTIEDVSNMLLPFDPPTVRVEVREHEQVLSVPVQASYGFQDATKDVRLRLEESTHKVEKNTMVVFLSDKPGSATVELHLIDANTGMSLKSLLNIEIDLSLFQ